MHTGVWHYSSFMLEDAPDSEKAWRGRCNDCLWIGEWNKSEKLAREIAQRHADGVSDEWQNVPANCLIIGKGSLLFFCILVFMVGVNVGVFLMNHWHR